MGLDRVGFAAYLAQVDAGPVAPDHDRFAHWPHRRALMLLLVVLVLLGEAALVPLTVGHARIATPPPLGALLGRPVATPHPRDADLALYDTAIARIRRGESYYQFIVAEHRRAHYPIRPAVAVRLPTLAYLDAWLGVPGQIVAALGLLVAVLWAWWGRLAQEPGLEQGPVGDRTRRLAIALLFTGAALGLNRSYFVLHELWAGMLIALAFALHRPALPANEDDTAPRSRWLAAWCVAALALAIREQTLPFVLLMAAYAAWRRAWREAQAWVDLALLFVLGLALHLHVIGHQALPGDPLGPSWLAWRGLGGWLSDVVLSSNLRFAPHWAAGPLVVLMILGWAGWRSPAGSFATLLYLGYGAAFMIAGRDDNFYWGAIIAPTMVMGLAFAPMALRSLVQSALAVRHPGLRPTAFTQAE